MWLADGTFSTAPHQFVQLYTFHGIHSGSIYPFINVLMSRRTKEMYIAVLTTIVNTSAEKVFKYLILLKYNSVI